MSDHKNTILAIVLSLIVIVLHRLSASGTAAPANAARNAAADAAQAAITGSARCIGAERGATRNSRGPRDADFHLAVGAAASGVT